MPFLTKIPKDSVELYTDRLDDYTKWVDHWTRNGWLLSSDFENGLYTAIALKDARVLIIMHKDKNWIEPQPLLSTMTPSEQQSTNAQANGEATNEDTEGIEAERQAIEQLNSR